MTNEPGPQDDQPLDRLRAGCSSAPSDAPWLPQLAPNQSGGDRLSQTRACTDGSTAPAGPCDGRRRPRQDEAGARPGGQQGRWAIGAVAIDRHPVAALILASAMWGGAVSAVKFALGGFDALTLLTIELLAATTVLWAALIAGGYRPPRSWTVAVVLGLLEPGLSYLLEAIGLTRTGAVDGSLISGLEPALVVLLAALLLREAIGISAALAVIVGLGGVALIMDSGGASSAIGDLLLAAGVLAASLYSIVAKRFDDDSDALAVTVGQFTAAAILCTSILAGRTAVTGAMPNLTAASGYWIVAITVGVLGFGASFLIYNRVLLTCDAGWTAIVLNLIPMFGLLAAVGVLGERLSPRSGVGALLLGGSVGAFCALERRHEAAEPVTSQQSSRPAPVYVNTADSNQWS
jgi:O-acetylserine/cysteine efflux transporter